MESVVFRITSMSALKNKHLIMITFLRLCISGFLAILILNFLMSFYYMLPLHIDNPMETTDYMAAKFELDK